MIKDAIKATLPVTALKRMSVITLVLLGSMTLSWGGPSSPVSADQALRDAQTIAAMRPHWSVVRCNGDSMDPHFGNNSLALVDALPYGTLKPQMIVIYRDPSGDLVGHRLIEKTDSGWIAQAVNNRNPDPYRITENNYIGVIFGLIHYDGNNRMAENSLAALPLIHGKRY
jgi:hypothetical protein